MSLTSYLDERPAKKLGSAPSTATRQDPLLDVLPEIRAQLERYNSGEDKPPWTGAIPDMSKLQASTQMDTMGLWWGWDAPEWFRKSTPPELWFGWVPQRRCDFCIYEAGGFYQGIYFCRLHQYLVI